MSKDHQEHKIPVWLQKIQDNSSELELLISGGAIFGLIQFSDFIANNLNNLIFLFTSIGIKGVIGLFIIILQTTLSCLIIGFILHLMVRAYWLALVCLNYVYPNGINWDKLNIKKPYYIEKEQRNDLYNKIIAADKICGLIMFTCIAASIIIFGFALIIIPMILIFVLLEQIGLMDNDWISNLLGFGVFVPVCLYIIDLLLSGILRKIPYVSYITYPFFKFFDIITLRFLITKGLWILSSNTSIYKRTIIIGVLIMISFLYGLENMSKQSSLLFKLDIAELDIKDNKQLGSYRDSQAHLPSTYSIDSKIISKNFIRLQIKYDGKLETYLKTNTELNIKDVYTIRIDDVKIDNFDWSVFKRDQFHRGLELIIPIDNFEKGKHLLTIEDHSRLVKSMPLEDSIKHIKRSITFWYDKLAANNK
tara:strand:- start:330 stop:1589 length:1260 start_codon:yes stop_codon:yes gene_type:complete